MGNKYWYLFSITSANIHFILPVNIPFSLLYIHIYAGIRYHGDKVLILIVKVCY